jgi:hypothetical protein
LGISGTGTGICVRELPRNEQWVCLQFPGKIPKGGDLPKKDIFLGQVRILQKLRKTMRKNFLKLETQGKTVDCRSAYIVTEHWFLRSKEFSYSLDANIF